MTIVEPLLGTIIGRWYVTIFGLVFLWEAVRHLGARRVALYTAVAVVVGILAENGSVRIGFPYGYYTFDPALRGHELWVGDVPLMVTLSYTFMAYFAFATGRLLVAGPWRTRGGPPLLEFAVSVMVAVWALWIVDPVSRLGEHFFLGHLFRYRDDGIWFGLHLQSQLGFTLTSLVLIGFLTWLAADEPAQPADGLVGHPRFGAFAGYLGQVFFMTGTAFWVSRTTEDPAVARQAAMLTEATFLILIPAALMTAVYWRSLRPLTRDCPPSPPSNPAAA